VEDEKEITFFCRSEMERKAWLDAFSRASESREEAKKRQKIYS